MTNIYEIMMTDEHSSLIKYLLYKKGKIVPDRVAMIGPIPTVNLLMPCTFNANEKA